MTERTVIPIDLVELRLAWLFEKHGEEALKAAQQGSEEIERASFADVDNGSLLEPAESEPRLRSWLEAIENRMSDIAATDSRRIWFFLVHRLKASKARYQSSDLTVRLYRQILKLAVLKHGTLEGTPFTCLPADFGPREEWVLSEDGELPSFAALDGGYSVPVRVSADHLSRLILLERLAYDYWAATSLLRRIWKGGQLPIADGLAENAIHAPDVTWLIELYDERLRHASLLSHFGSMITLDVHGGGSLRILDAQLNLEDVPIQDLPVGGGAQRLVLPNGFTPNFLVLVPDLTGVWELTNDYADDLELANGIRAQEVLLFFLAITYRQMVVWRERPAAQLQL